MDCVSVIIPVFNCQSEIGTALSSVVAQTYENLDIIVVDDASTDATRTVAASFRDPRIRILSHEQNRGAAAARNTGLHAMRGVWVAFLDADDAWSDRNKIVLQMQFLTNAGSTFKAVTCDYTMLHQNGWAERKFTDPSDINIIRFGCQRANVASCLLASRAVAEQVGLFDSALEFNEDVDWLLRFIEYFPDRVAGVPIDMVTRNASPIRGPEARLADAKVLSRHENLLAVTHDSKAVRNFKAKRELDVAFAYHQQGRTVKALCSLASSVLLAPQPVVWFAQRAIRHSRHSSLKKQSLAFGKQPGLSR